MITSINRLSRSHLKLLLKSSHSTGFDLGKSLNFVLDSTRVNLVHATQDSFQNSFMDENILLLKINNG